MKTQKKQSLIKNAGQQTKGEKEKKRKKFCRYKPYFFINASSALQIKIPLIKDRKIELIRISHGLAS